MVAETRILYIIISIVVYKIYFHIFFSLLYLLGSQVIEIFFVIKWLNNDVTQRFEFNFNEFI
jgi:hypothetical protein